MGNSNLELVVVGHEQWVPEDKYSGHAKQYLKGSLIFWVGARLIQVVYTFYETNVEYLIYALGRKEEEVRFPSMSAFTHQLLPKQGLDHEKARQLMETHIEEKLGPILLMCIDGR